MGFHYDSQATIKALNFYVIDSKLIWQCRIKLNETDKKNKISSIWFPGQLGIRGKDFQMSLTDPEPFCGIVKNSYKKEFLVKEKAERKHFGGIT